MPSSVQRTIVVMVGVLDNNSEVLETGPNLEKVGTWGHAQFGPPGRDGLTPLGVPRHILVWGPPSWGAPLPGETVPVGQSP